MDEIKNKIKNILQKEFSVDENTDDNDRLFHQLDSINYFRYIIFIEKEFNINVEKNVYLRTINEAAEYISEKTK